MYGQKHSDHTHWRNYTVEVARWAGWAASYLVLRELPVRNFYGRSIIMGTFLLHYGAQFGLPWPFNWISAQRAVMKYDRYAV